MHRTEMEAINPAEEKKERNALNTLPVDQQQLNVKQKGKEKPGEKQNDKAD